MWGAGLRATFEVWGLGLGLWNLVLRGDLIGGLGCEFAGRGRVCDLPLLEQSALLRNRKLLPKLLCYLQRGVADSELGIRDSDSRFGLRVQEEHAASDS